MKIPKLENIPRSNKRPRCNKCLKNITLGVNGNYIGKLKNQRFILEVKKYKEIWG